MTRVESMLEMFNRLWDAKLEIKQVRMESHHEVAIFKMGLDTEFVCEVNLPDQDRDLSLRAYLKKYSYDIWTNLIGDSSCSHFLEKMIELYKSNSFIIFSDDYQHAYATPDDIYRVFPSSYFKIPKGKALPKEIEEKKNRFHNDTTTGPATLLRDGTVDNIQVDFLSSTVRVPASKRTATELDYYLINEADGTVTWVSLAEKSMIAVKKYSFFVNSYGFIKSNVAKSALEVVKTLINRPGYWDSPVLSAKEREFLNLSPYEGIPNEYTGKNFIVAPDDLAFYVKFGGNWISVTEDFILYSDLPEDVRQEVQVWRNLS